MYKGYIFFIKVHILRWVCNKFGRQINGVLTKIAQKYARLKNHKLRSELNLNKQQSREKNYLLF